MRRKFLLGMLGALGLAKAQPKCIVLLSNQDGTTSEHPCDTPLAWKTERAKNGQCPVCGTMAPPFKPTIEELQALGPCAPVSSSGNIALSVCRSWSKSDLPKSQEVRCARCNVKFVQDAD